jgi:hypothetical protein
MSEIQSPDPRSGTSQPQGWRILLKPHCKSSCGKVPVTLSEQGWKIARRNTEAQRRIRTIKKERQRAPLQVDLPSTTRARVERLLYATEFTQSEIAVKCGVTQSKVSAIARDIGLGRRTRKARYPSRARTKRNREIIRLVKRGRTYREVGQRYGITRQRVHLIVKLYGTEHSRTEHPKNDL